MIHTRQQARKLLLALICVELLFVVAYGTDAWVQGEEGQLHELINLDAEGNLPTWFSSFQLALIAISFSVLGMRARETQRPSRRFLRLCGGFFLLLSVDETALLHERLTACVGSRYIEWVPGYLKQHIGEGVICGLVFLGLVAAALPHIVQLWRLSSRATLIAVAGCVIYVAGGAVLETVGYRMLCAGVPLSLYRAEVAAEEFLEMFGASLILYSTLLLCCRGPLRGSQAPGERRVTVSVPDLSIR